MNDEQFIAEVRNLAKLDTDEDARKAIGATLETLKERLAGEEPSDLAAQLPPEIAPYVEGDGGQESFSVEEFYERVAQKESVDNGEAVRHARAVASVLKGHAQRHRTRTARARRRLRPGHLVCRSVRRAADHETTRPARGARRYAVSLRSSAVTASRKALT